MNGIDAKHLDKLAFNLGSVVLNAIALTQIGKKRRSSMVKASSSRTSSLVHLLRPIKGGNVDKLIFQPRLELHRTNNPNVLLVIINSLLRTIASPS